MLRLYDTATRRVRELALREPGRVSIYLCGPTVYGPPHLGHGRATLEYDVLVRYLRWTGLDVQFVSNVTDIDDKIINRAVNEGRDWHEIAHKCEDVWFRAMESIGNARPDGVPHATEYVEQMVAMIGQLVELGRAYNTDDGVYLSVVTVEDYGLLAHQSLDEMLAGGGERDIFGAELKRHPADFVLWKLAKPGEPSWESPWGPGRPGWHSECVVMSLDILGEGFDLHAGGQDLRFPHHENERAQAVALGRRFANHWMHHGMVVDSSGEKMSKSLGNFFTIHELLADWPGEVLRFNMLRTHYRQPIDWTAAGLEESWKTLDDWYWVVGDAAGGRISPQVLAALGDDLNTHQVITVLHGLRNKAQAGDENARGELAASLNLLGFLNESAAEWAARRQTNANVDATKVQSLIDARTAARASKDFKESDRIRDELAAMGVVLKDSKEGTTWEVAR